MPHENVEIVREFLDSFNSEDYEACLEMIDPDVEWHLRRTSRTPRSPTGVTL
ncbi:MAG: hypothetical protein ACRDMA_12405 [Solirubrobacterales bacterium]